MKCEFERLGTRGANCIDIENIPTDSREPRSRARLVRTHSRAKAKLWLSNTPGCRAVSQRESESRHIRSSSEPLHCEWVRPLLLWNHGHQSMDHSASRAMNKKAFPNSRKPPIAPVLVEPSFTVSVCVP
eukprot:scaffold261567_cov35-Tisochrysis_lutea.AAC.1